MLTEHGIEQLRKVLRQEHTRRNDVWLSLSPARIIRYYLNRRHRRLCAMCRRAYTMTLAKEAGVNDYYEEDEQ